MPLVNPDEEIIQGFTQLEASASKRATPPASPAVRRERPNNFHNYGEVGLGSGRIFPEGFQSTSSSPSTPPPPLPSSSPQPPKFPHYKEDEEDSYTVGILDLPSPPTFFPVEDDDIEAQEQMIKKLWTESTSSTSPNRVLRRDNSPEKRAFLLKNKAFSASLVHSQHQQKSPLMDEGDLAKYLRIIESNRQQRIVGDDSLTEEVEVIGRIYDKSEVHEKREASPYIREEAILVMGMGVEATGGAIYTEEDEYSWVDDTKNGKSFKISKNLAGDGIVQGKFFMKVMWVKAFQLIWISLWLLLVGQISRLKSAIISCHDWAFFVTLGLFIALFIVIRLLGRKKSKWSCCSVTLLLILLTSIIAYPLASVQYKYDIQIVSVSVWTLLVSCILMGAVPFLCQCISTPPNWGHTGVVVVILSGVTVLLISIFAQMSEDIRTFTVYIWFPSLFIAEIVLWMMVWELRCIVEGYAFTASETRWYFAALWV